VYDSETFRKKYSEEVVYFSKEIDIRAELGCGTDFDELTLHS
jgi:hypothetical protein